MDTQTPMHTHNSSNDGPKRSEQEKRTAYTKRQLFTPNSAFYTSRINYGNNATLYKWSVSESIILNLLKQKPNKLMRKAGCMCTHPKLYVAGIEYGWRKLRGVWRSTRKKLCVGKSHTPLSVAFRRGAHNTATTTEGERQDADKSSDDYNWRIQHVYL